MIDQNFIRGSGVTVKLNGSAVGGVLSAVCKRKNNLMVVLNIILEPMQVVKYNHVNVVL